MLQTITLASTLRCFVFKNPAERFIGIVLDVLNQHRQLAIPHFPFSVFRLSFFPMRNGERRTENEEKAMLQVIHLLLPSTDKAGGLYRLCDKVRQRRGLSCRPS